MKFQGNIIELTLANNYFRQVLATNASSQLVLMTILPGEDIGLEIHHDVDQTLVFVEGEGQALVGGQASLVKTGDLIVVPAGTEHNFINTGKVALKLYTIYSPAEHPDGTVHKTKADALADQEDHV